MPPTLGRSVEELLLIVLVQLIVLIAAPHVVGTLFLGMGQPRLVGEIVAGLLLGQSVFGRFFPEMSDQIFRPEGGPIFALLSQIGFVFLMFLVGNPLRLWPHPDKPTGDDRRFHSSPRFAVPARHPAGFAVTAGHRSCII